MIADAVAVEAQIIEPLRRDVDHGSPDCPIHMERLAQERRRQPDRVSVFGSCAPVHQVVLGPAGARQRVGSGDGGPSCDVSLSREHLHLRQGHAREDLSHRPQTCHGQADVPRPSRIEAIEGRLGDCGCRLVLTGAIDNGPGIGEVHLVGGLELEPHGKEIGRSVRRPVVGLCGMQAQAVDLLPCPEIEDDPPVLVDRSRLASVAAVNLAARVGFPRGVEDRLGIPDPLRAPVGSLEEPHGPVRRLTPRRLLAVAIPDAHRPVAVLPADQRRAGVDDVDGLIGGDLAAVPEVAVTALQLLGAAGDEHLIGRLRLAAFARQSGPQDPAQPGPRDVDA